MKTCIIEHFTLHLRFSTVMRRAHNFKPATTLNCYNNYFIFFIKEIYFSLLWGPCTLLVDAEQYRFILRYDIFFIYLNNAFLAKYL